jgi:hypothetical protein
MKNFTPAEIETFTRFGFIVDADKHSGFPYKNVADADRGDAFVLIKQDVGYKLELHETYSDGEGGYETDYTSTFSNLDQTLEQFLTAKI